MMVLRLVLLVILCVLSACDAAYDPDLYDQKDGYTNPCKDSIDNCFDESIISYEYAVWDIEAKEWIELDYAQRYAGFSPPSGYPNLFSLKENFVLDYRLWNLTDGFSTLVSAGDMNSNNFVNNFYLIKKTYTSNEVPLFFFDGIEQKIITSIDTSDIIKFVSNNEEMYFQMKSKKSLQKFDPINFSLSDTEIDTSIVAGSDYIKLIDRYALLCDLKSYIKLINIDTGNEISFTISINQNDDVHFEREFFHNLDNSELDNDKIYLSSLYIDEIEGLSTGQSSFIEIDGSSVNLIPLPGFAQETYAIKNGVIYFEMDFTTKIISTSQYPEYWSSDNDGLNRMHYLEIDTGDIYNMNGGLCCGCLDRARDIRGIAANDSYVAVTGGFCKAGRDKNKKIN